VKVIKRVMKRRTWEVIECDVLKLMINSEKSLSTKTIANICNLDYRSALNHLRQLEFDDHVLHHTRGVLGRVNYWKIKR